MDKCIKVLIPTGEIRIVKTGKIFYEPVDEKSKSNIDRFKTGDCWISVGNDYNDWVGDWVDYEDQDGKMFFPVIAQYGDEFPV